MFVGARQITGFADGTGIKAMRDEDSLTLQTGMDGEHCVTRNQKRSGTIELTLMAASASNDYLAALMTQHEDLGTGFFPSQVKDLRGASMCRGADCFVSKPSDMERAKEHGTTSWKIVVPDMAIFNGGIVGV